MSHLIESMEQLGSNPTLRSKVRVNCLDALVNLGVSKQLSSALVLKNTQEITRLMKTRDKMFLYISVPSGLSSKVNKTSTIVNSKVSIKLQVITSKAA